MKFNVITIFPELIAAGLSKGIIGQAVATGKMSVNYTNPREFTVDKHRSVDDRPFGGGDGMVMLAEPLEKSILAAKKDFPKAKVVYLSAQGKKFNQEMAKTLSQESEMILLCGRYGGVDQRLINQHVDMEISVGDYVLSGGELAAMILIDVMGRLIPEVLGNKESVTQDSFMQPHLEGPLFTRPQEFNGQAVPGVLLSGDHERVKKFNHMLGVFSTYVRRPDLLNLKNKPKLDTSEIKKLTAADLTALGFNHDQVLDFISYLENHT